MTVMLDACAVLAVLRGEPAAAEMRPILRDDDVLIHPLNLGEVIDRMVRLARADADDVEADVAMLGVRTIAVEETDLIDAGRWRARHYHRSDRPVSLADCVAAVSAVRTGAALATSDVHCAAVVRAEGGKVLALPSSTGKRP